MKVKFTDPTFTLSYSQTCELLRQLREASMTEYSRTECGHIQHSVITLRVEKTKTPPWGFLAKIKKFYFYLVQIEFPPCACPAKGKRVKRIKCPNGASLAYISN